MKTTRKIIPALVMLLVSAVMLSTASFAWLASSTEVSAGPMTVQANTDVVFMQISNDETNWGRSARALNATSGDLELVNATVDEDVITWRTAEGGDPGKHDKDGDYTAVDPINATYALINTFYVQMSNATSTLYNLTISEVAVNEVIAADSFDEALRVLVVATDKTDKVIGYQCWDLGTDALSTVGGFSADDILAATVTDDTITLSVYIYYDGEDTQAFTNKLNTATSKEITVSFSASETNS